MKKTPEKSKGHKHFSLEVSKADIQILIAEDEDETRLLLQRCLEREGYKVVGVRNGQEALQAYAAGQFDLVVLDINMPQIDGWAVCAELRKRTDVPIMMLTASTRPDDIVHGIQLGADNYVTKPFTLKEVRARVQAVLRRATQKTKQENEKVLVCGDIALNESTCEVTVRNQRVELTPNEFRLLYYFMQNPDTPISKEKLLDAVWDYQYQLCEDLNFIRVTIRRLRNKVEEDSSNPKYLKTVHGRGYQLCSGKQDVSLKVPAAGQSSFAKQDMVLSI